MSFLKKNNLLIFALVTAGLVFFSNVCNAVLSKNFMKFFTMTIYGRFLLTLAFLSLLAYVIFFENRGKLAILAPISLGLFTLCALSKALSVFTSLISGTYKGFNIILYLLVFMLYSAEAFAFGLLTYRCFTGSKKGFFVIKQPILAVIACGIPAVISTLIFLFSDLIYLIKYFDIFEVYWMIFYILNMLCEWAIPFALYFAVFIFIYTTKFSKFGVIKEPETDDITN